MGPIGIVLSARHRHSTPAVVYWLDACTVTWLGGCVLRLVQRCWAAVVGWRCVCVGAFGDFLFQFPIAYACLTITSFCNSVCWPGNMHLFRVRLHMPQSLAALVDQQPDTTCFGDVNRLVEATRVIADFVRSWEGRCSSSAASVGPSCLLVTAADDAEPIRLSLPKILYLNHRWRAQTLRERIWALFRL